MTRPLRRLFSMLRPRLRAKYPTVRQYDRTDCGAACLLSVLRFHNGDASLVTVRELAHTGVNGTSMWSLCKAAESLGLKATGVRGTYENLSEAQLPCIAHFVLEDGRPHFVVVFRFSSRGVLVGDPASGLNWMSRQAFCERWKTGTALLLAPTDALHKTPPRHWLSWVVGYFRREEAWLTQSLFMGFAYASLGLLTALFVRVLIDRFIPDGDLRGIIAVGIGLLVLQVVRGIVGYLRSWLLIELNRRVNTRMTVDALDHLFRLPAGFFESRRTGDITTRINDSVKIHAALLGILGNTAIDAMIVLGSLAILFYLAPPFGLMSLAFLCMLSVLTVLSARRIRGLHFSVKKAYAGVQASYIDSIEAIDPIRGTNSSKVFGGLLGSMYDQMQRGLARLGIVQTRISTTVEMAAGLVVVCALTIGSAMVVRDSLTLGAMMAAYSLLASTVPAAARIIDAHLQLQEATVASTRLLDLLLVETEPARAESSFAITERLSLVDASFGWPGASQLFGNINMDIPRGRITAVCGRSGVGKSTLVKILDRRYSVTGGALVVDDTIADNVSLFSYRRNVATIPESVDIINGTIAENILLGRSVENPQQISDRIEELGLARFMARFPNGIFTLIGDDGWQISSGERQTLGLLRALWETPDVLLVDEGMNAVDIETTRLFLDTLKRYAEHHAVLVVSHQPRTLLQADFVYVMGEGGMVEAGPPKQLVATRGVFASIISPDPALARSA